MKTWAGFLALVAVLGAALGTSCVTVGTVPKETERIALLLFRDTAKSEAGVNAAEATENVFIDAWGHDQQAFLDIRSLADKEHEALPTSLYSDMRALRGLAARSGADLLIVGSVSFTEKSPMEGLLPDQLRDGRMVICRGMASGRVVNAVSGVILATQEVNSDEIDLTNDECRHSALMSAATRLAHALKEGLQQWSTIVP